MFTVLISVYFREKPEALDRALASLAAQTLPPAEVVLVKDGPLTPELDAVIGRHARQLPMKLLPLEHNIGLAGALNAGLRLASQPWIMRFDSDDICQPNRVQVQAAMAADGALDLFGAQIGEFESDPSAVGRARTVPCDHADILKFARRRNPFNHMTVCYRRELVLGQGGYPAIPLMEDYALWAQLLAAGARTANSAERLVLARVGNGMLARRGGMRYVRSEWSLQRLLVRLGLKSLTASLVDGCVRSAVFLSPTVFRGWAYGRLLRQRQ
jgi:glycosyltransferase involved in cell wall biosynthesis